MRCKADGDTLIFTPSIEDTEALAALSNTGPDANVAQARTLLSRVEDGTINAATAAAIWQKRNGPIRGPHASVIAELAADDPDEVARAARSRHTPGDLLVRLFHDGPTEVAAAVAKNPSTPVSLLRALAHDPALPPHQHLERAKTRGLALANPSCPTDVHDRIARTSTSRLLLDVIGERITDPKAFYAIARTVPENASVWRTCLRNPHCPAEILNHQLKAGEYRFARVDVLANPTQPADALRRHLFEGDSYAARGAAENPNTSPSDLHDAVAVWTHRRRVLVLSGIARNPNTPPASLAALFNETTATLDGIEDVWQRTLTHPNATPAVAAAAAAWVDDWPARSERLPIAAKNRLGIAGKPAAV